MGAHFSKNELTASKRRADLYITNPNTGEPAPRGTNFTGYVYVDGATGSYALGTGTITNKRRALVVADDAIESVDTVADTATLTGHSYETGDGPFIADEAIGSLTAGTDFWIISVDANTIAFAASLEDAYSDTREALTGTETGATIADTVSTERGLDGPFIYEATQAETNVDASEFSIYIVHPTYAGLASVSMGGDLGFEQTAEGSHTYGDLLRLLVGVVAGRASGFNTGTLVFKSLDASKTRLTVTTDATGRLTSTVGDLT